LGPSAIQHFVKVSVSVLSRFFSNSKTFILQGAGHFIQEDALDRIVEEFRLWWQEGQKSRI
jgi:hypothetical protein